MINTALPDINVSAASTPIMPQRTPMASCYKTHRQCRHQRLSAARYRSVHGAPATHSAHAAAAILASSTSADVQIPIALRIC
jgi:hypothetical protein